MNSSAVFVDCTPGRHPREIHRDARDPQGDSQAELESWCVRLSENGRRVRLFAHGQYVKPWRKRLNDPLYEARDGQIAEGYQ